MEETKMDTEPNDQGDDFNQPSTYLHTAKYLFRHVVKSVCLVACPTAAEYFKADGKDYCFPQDFARLKKQRREDETDEDVTSIMNDTKTTVFLFTGVPEDKIIPYLLWFEAMHDSTVVSWRPHFTAYFDKNLSKKVDDTSRYTKFETPNVFRRNYVVEFSAPSRPVHHGRHKVDQDFYGLRLSDCPGLGELTVAVQTFHGTWVVPESYTIGFFANLPPWLTVEKLTHLIDEELKLMGPGKPRSFHLVPDFWTTKPKRGQKKSSRRKTAVLRIKAADSNVARAEIDAFLGNAGVLNVLEGENVIYVPSGKEARSFAHNMQSQRVRQYNKTEKSDKSNKIIVKVDDDAIPNSWFSETNVRKGGPHQVRIMRPEELSKVQKGDIVNLCVTYQSPEAATNAASWCESSDSDDSAEFIGLKVSTFASVKTAGSIVKEFSSKSCLSEQFSTTDYLDYTAVSTVVEAEASFYSALIDKDDPLYLRHWPNIIQAARTDDWDTLAFGVEKQQDLAGMYATAQLSSQADTEVIPPTPQPCPDGSGDRRDAELAALKKEVKELRDAKNADPESQLGSEVAALKADVKNLQESAPTASAEDESDLRTLVIGLTKAVNLLQTSFQSITTQLTTMQAYEQETRNATSCFYDATESSFAQAAVTFNHVTSQLADLETRSPLASRKRAANTTKSDYVHEPVAFDNDRSVKQHLDAQGDLLNKGTDSSPATGQLPATGRKSRNAGR